MFNLQPLMQLLKSRIADILSPWAVLGGKGDKSGGLVLGTSLLFIYLFLFIFLIITLHLPSCELALFLS